MPADFMQNGSLTDTDAALCSGNTNNTDKARSKAGFGDTGSGTPGTFGVDSSASDLNFVWVELDDLSGYSDDDTTGDWTWRLNVTNGNMQVTLDEVHICHTDSSYTAKTTVTAGQTGLGINLSTAQVYSSTQAQTGALNSFDPDNDKIIVIFAVDNAQAMNQLIDIQFNQNITAPGSWSSAFAGADDEEWAQPWLATGDPDVTVYA